MALTTKWVWGRERQTALVLIYTISGTRETAKQHSPALLDLIFTETENVGTLG